MSEATSSIASITISDESSNDAPYPVSETGPSTQKPRNIAVKKGTPAATMQRSIPQRSKEKGSKWEKDLLKGTRFLEDFNPENSKREKNKRDNISKTNMPKKKSNSMYDEQGRIRMTKEDVCDCFDLTCAGCHFPCPSCQSLKCGIRCRVNRRWAYDKIELDGRNQPIMNPLLTTTRY